MGKYRNWNNFKNAMGRHNEEARKNLCQQREIRSVQEPVSAEACSPQENRIADSIHDNASEECVQLRNRIVHSLQEIIPEEEKENSGCCVIVSLEELRTVRSLDPDNYLVKTQVALITDLLMRCKSTKDLWVTLRNLEAYGIICSGSRLLALNPVVRFVLQQYVVPVEERKQKVSKIG